MIWLKKLKWVLFGKKSYKQAMYEINKERGLTITRQKRFRPSNGNYASTKRTK